jgi:hypothetical protein
MIVRKSRGAGCEVNHNRQIFSPSKIRSAYCLYSDYRPLTTANGSGADAISTGQTARVFKFGLQRDPMLRASEWVWKQQNADHRVRQSAIFPETRIQVLVTSRHCQEQDLHRQPQCLLS